MSDVLVENEKVVTPTKLHPLVEKYIRQERMPHSACSGCGIGQVVQYTLVAIDELGLSPLDTVWVQGVGCSSRLTYTLWKGDCIDAHHGRIYAVATGLKMARPDLNFILFTGDGDSGAIGGNHFIHACRRNLDVTALMFNNGIYGLTGGQVAPTTPYLAKTTTTPHGNFEEPFDMCKVAEAAGANYVARWHSLQYRQIVNSIKKGIRTRGFAYIEIIVQCHPIFGRYVLGSDDPINTLRWIKEHTVSISKAKTMKEEELRDKLIVGEFVHRDRPGLVERYRELIARARG